MAVGERSFVVEETPEKIWAILTDLNRWDYLFRTQTLLKTFAPSYRILPPGILGSGMRYSVSTGRGVIQTWRVVSWKPPTSFVSGQTWSRSRLFSTRGLFGFSLRPLPPLSTQVKFVAQMEYSHSSFGPILNFCFGRLLGIGVQSVLENLDKKASRLISGAL